MYKVIFKKVVSKGWCKESNSLRKCAHDRRLSSCFDASLMFRNALLCLCFYVHAMCCYYYDCKEKKRKKTL